MRFPVVASVGSRIDVLGVRHSAECFGIKRFYIAENGVCQTQSSYELPECSDPDRREYVRLYLKELHRACCENYRVDGYFHWSFLDNFEWAEGFMPRFGLIGVDYRNQARIARLSATWFSNVARSNGF